MMHSGILSTIGHTPLVSLNRLYAQLPAKLYAKLEMFNPGGSIKDRPAFMMLTKALEEGKLKEKATVIESSSGNFAIGLAQACRYLDINLRVVVDPKINPHTLKILQTYGARIESVSRPDADGNYLSARLQRVDELLDSVPDSYWPNQYANKYNPAAHYQTMEEIIYALPDPPDYLLAATSTCGTLMGCANYVRQHMLKTKIVAVDAVGSVIFGTSPSERLVPGHGAGRASDLLDRRYVDHILHITDEECIVGCRRLLRHEAILAGGSSGAVVMAVEKMQSKIPDGSTCALILPDSGERYLETVFNDEWVEEQFGENSDALNQLDSGPSRNKFKLLFPSNGSSNTIEKPAPKNGRKTETRKIAIIGGGPKGMYGFERLAAQFNAHPPEGKIEIHVYNRTSHFGAGDIYRTDQPPYLLMNNAAGEINMWIDEDPPPVVSEPLSLTDWLRREEGRNVTENDYVNRASVGRYLKKGFELIASNLPDGVSGKYMIGEVIDLYTDKEKYAIRLKTSAGSPVNVAHRYDQVLLATGHPRNQAAGQEKQFQQFAGKKKETGFIPFIYPVEPALTDIPPDCNVGIKGMGLTFVDAALALTEGKGGRFTRDRKYGKLYYEPSGREPKTIYPFSRSGLPMLPRGPAPGNETSLKFLTETALHTLRNQGPVRKIDFKKQILPLVRQEMLFSFYHIKLKQAGFKEDLSTAATFAEVQHHIRLYHEQHPKAKHFDPNQFLEPLTGQNYHDAEAFNAYIHSYLKFFLQEARQGERESAWAAVIAVWRKATPIVGSFYAFGGFTPDSHHFFDACFRRLINRVSFGPPVESVEKLAALMKTGILNFEMAQNPTVTMNKKTGVFALESERYGILQPVHYLVDARISRVSLPDDRASLYRTLLDSGLITMYENRSDQGSYQPGCVSVSPWGFVINEKGAANSDIAVTGTPTEGITFDNDALSRYRNNFVSNWAAYVRKLYTKSTVGSHESR